MHPNMAEGWWFTHAGPRKKKGRRKEVKDLKQKVVLSGTLPAGMKWGKPKRTPDQLKNKPVSATRDCNWERFIRAGRKDATNHYDSSLKSQKKKNWKGNATCVVRKGVPKNW